MNIVYQPSKGVTNRIKRRLAPLQAQRRIPVKLDRPIISFTFDDCPASVLTHGLPCLEKKGWQSTFYLAGGLLGTENHLGKHMTKEDAVSVHASGHEIGGHTFSHMDISACPPHIALQDIDRNCEMFDDIGLPAAETFAYPYGQVTSSMKRILETRFKGARGITPQVHTKRVDLNQIGSLPLFNDASFKMLLSTIEALKDAPGWMTLFTHDIRPKPSSWGCTPEQFQAVIDAVERAGAQVLSVKDAIKTLKNATV